MALKLFLIFGMLTLAAGQRPGFAGTKPIGFPEVYNRTTTTAEGIKDRFGNDDVTTQRLPIEANGDRDLIDRLSKLPVEKQPFWFINWQALEANRNKPQSYPQKPNVFVDPIPNTGTQSGTANRVVPNSNTASTNELPNRFPEESDGNTESNQGANNATNSNLGTENRFGSESTNVASSSTTETNPGNGASSTNSGVDNRFSATESNIPSSTNKEVNNRDGNESHSLPSHRRFRPRIPVIDN